MLAVLGLAAAPAAAGETASIHGRVVDVRGDPVPGFPLRVVDDEGRSMELRTGRDGSFAALGLSPGRITVGLEGSGYARSTASCRIQSGMVGLANLIARAGGGQLAATCRVEPPPFDVYIIE